MEWMRTVAIVTFCVLAMAFAFAVRADTTAWCASPGPHGEVLYCTDDEKRLPAVLLDSVVRRELTGLDDYERFTKVDVQPDPYWWLGCDRSLYRPARWVPAGLEAVLPLPYGSKPYVRLRVARRDLVRMSWGEVCWK